MPTRSTSRRQNGFSLPEALVCLGLLSILLTAIYGLVNLAFRHAKEAEVFETVHQQAIVGIHRISRELEITSAASTAPTGADYLTFGSPHQPIGVPNHETYTHDANGNLEWYKWVTFYLDSNSATVYRIETPLPSKSPSPPLTPDQPLITDLKAITDNRRTVVCRNCIALSFSPGVLTPGTIRVRLETSGQFRTDKPTTLKLDTEVLPRNEP